MKTTRRSFLTSLLLVISPKPASNKSVYVTSDVHFGHVARWEGDPKYLKMTVGEHAGMFSHDTKPFYEADWILTPTWISPLSDSPCLKYCRR